MILQTPQRDFAGTRTMDDKVCIGHTSINKYMPKYIKPMRNRNNITCGCDEYISAMLLQSDLNKCTLSQLEKLDKLYINYASTNFHKYLRSILLNTRIRIFQIIYIYI